MVLNTKDDFTNEKVLEISFENNLSSRFIKVYLIIFFVVIIFRNFDLNHMQNYKKIMGASRNYTEDGIQIEKYLKIGELHYNIIYEEASERYLVFSSYNVFIGYIDFEKEEKISVIDENNFYKYLVFGNLK